jgi:hypothetical protein
MQLADQECLPDTCVAMNGEQEPSPWIIDRER